MAADADKDWTIVAWVFPVFDRWTLWLNPATSFTDEPRNDETSETQQSSEESTATPEDKEGCPDTTDSSVEQGASESTSGTESNSAMAEESLPEPPLESEEKKEWLQQIQTFHSS